MNLSGRIYIPANTIVTLTAIPYANWTFGNWTGSVGGNSNITRVTMNGNKNIVANFRRR